ncbi:antibiotic biosynthesis monooxygenase family protein [Winogradskyella sediminis]|uniref:Antibiotic biosynthesis monooxygenase n=1 Tax=Winogradskyella sediminis TaxID=1382466 RepID=A0A1H1SAN6_9FLAO|nr:antibiotic biosynthesis monooxygenase [Winogradskyella sediminis]REG89283.1 antibiotic biosynthesis monooxygenase [Winogradskyella sediminis]SDS45047.1 Antibiotic biosynthesis monooxygenase [Winogradskyella sediminis]
MYTILYTIKIKPNQEEKFIKAWKELTTLIYKYEGSFGSRLHKKDALHFFAYAQWPDKHTFENAGGNLPEEAHHCRNRMREAYEKFEVLDKYEMIEDLLKPQRSE